MACMLKSSFSMTISLVERLTSASVSFLLLSSSPLILSSSACLCVSSLVVSNSLSSKLAIYSLYLSSVSSSWLSRSAQVSSSFFFLAMAF